MIILIDVIGGVVIVFDGFIFIFGMLGNFFVLVVIFVVFCFLIVFNILIVNLVCVDLLIVIVLILGDIVCYLCDRMGFCYVDRILVLLYCVLV